MVFKLILIVFIMINGEYFASRTIAHLVPAIDSLGTKQCEGRFKRISPKSNNLDGIIFNFDVFEEELDVLIERGEIEDFDKKIRATITNEFWKNKSLDYLRRQKDKYKGFLRNLSLKENGSGNYHFKANLNTKNEDKAFFAVLNCIIKPVLYSFSN